jgi:hypothetical protein
MSTAHCTPVATRERLTRGAPLRIPRRMDGHRFHSPSGGITTPSKALWLTEQTPDTAHRAAEKFLAGFSCTEADLWAASPYQLLGPTESDAVTLLSVLYQSAEFINIVAEYATAGQRARPIDHGTTLKRDGWLTHFRKNGAPYSAAGVWIRPNPTDGNGISDINIAAFRFAVLQFDSIAMPLQFSLIARLPLPVAAIIASGGKSLHAWVKIDSDNAESYRQSVARLCRILEPFGIDPTNPGNRNPARLSRLPGVSREIRGFGDKRQRLLYLNPTPDFRRIFG